MATLFHNPYVPSRKIRLILAEKNSPLNMLTALGRRLDFLMLNPSGEVPVLVGEASTVSAIVHFGMVGRKGGATLLPSSGLARRSAPPVSLV